jgi:hypothetical protein
LLHSTAVEHVGFSPLFAVVACFLSPVAKAATAAAAFEARSPTRRVVLLHDLTSFAAFWLVFGLRVLWEITSR